MAVPVIQFVAGWNVLQTLGEGAFGEVKLLENQETGEAVAMKTVDLATHPDAREAVRKEVCLHRILRHPNIIKFIGRRQEEHMQYMFLEYAVGGELFDKIEPDVGMEQSQAQKYFRDLVNGLEYLHQQGITHRDIKPENLLLDANDVLKIADFGMATLFRYNGKERELEKKCGTKPYIAPEVLLRPSYAAQPADIWSCGVVLVALLAGELPWDEPTFDCPAYVMWKDKDTSNFLNSSPWNKIDYLALSLLRKVLNTVPRYRATISSIKSHSWYNKDFHKVGAGFGSYGSQNILNTSGSNSSTNTGRILKSSTNKRFCSALDRNNSNAGAFGSLEDTRYACSQPNPHVDVSDHNSNPNDLGAAHSSKVLGPASFSQPANVDQHFVSTQLSQVTQSCHGTSTPLQKLVKRMTRLLVHTSLKDTITHLEDTFTKLNYSFKSNSANILTITTVDRRGTQLVFKANVLNMGQHILIDFRLSKGCGLDFKRQFLKIKSGVADIIIKGPVTWSMALATNMLPA